MSLGSSYFRIVIALFSPRILVLEFPSPGDLPNPGIEPGSPALQADTLPAEPPGKSPLEFTVRSNFLEFQVNKDLLKFL